MGQDEGPRQLARIRDPIRNGKPLRLCFGGKNGDEMGRNSVNAFICNIGAWGYMGRNRVSPLDMGIERGGRGAKIG